MADMFDYLEWYGDFDFQTVPFNEVDNLILAQLSYIKLDGALTADETLLLSEAQERVVQAHLRPSQDEGSHGAELDLPDNGPLISSRTNALLGAMAAAGRRFQDAHIGWYESRLSEKDHEQFAALTVLLPDGSCYLSFRGTDDTLVGWIEDCEISYRIIAAQTDALAYLRRVAKLTCGPFRVGGHSKGGNLAAYAAALAPELDARIIEVWCNDSPGFDDAVIPLSTFERLRNRIHLFTPEYSVVGALLSHSVEPIVINSAGKGVMEHSMVDWQVMRGEIVRGGDIHPGSIRVGKAFQQLLKSRDIAGRKQFIDELYEACLAHDIHTISDMMGASPLSMHALTDSLRSLDNDNREAMYDFLWGAMGGAVLGAAEESAAHANKALMPVREAVSTALAEVRKSGTEWLEDVRAKAEGRQHSTTTE
jgi:hypothetical protein